MTKSIGRLYISALVLAICITEFVIFGGLGIGISLASLIYLMCILLYGHQQGLKHNKRQIGFLGIIVATLGCFILFSNTLLRYGNVVFLVVILIIYTMDYLSESKYECFLPDWFVELLIKGIELPFANLEMPVKAIRTQLCPDKEKKVRIILKVLLGISVGIPILCGVMLLLMSSDAAFTALVRMSIDKVVLVGDIDIFGRLLCTVGVFWFVFCYFYGILFGKEKEEESIQKAESEEKRESDHIILVTVVTMVCLVYIVFCLSQGIYFVSAFKGVLPGGFSFAEYARRGFFETLPLGMFNLVMICILSTKRNRLSESIKKKYMLYLAMFLAVFSMFITISAFSKMFMYMKQYGLTIKRVQVAWALALIIMIIVMVSIKIYSQQFKLFRGLFIMISAMYLGLNYANVDYLVAKCNISLYKQGIKDNLSGCYDLSSSAIGPIVEGLEGEELDDVQYILEEIATQSSMNVRSSKWQEWNAADSYARSVMDSIHENNLST